MTSSPIPELLRAYDDAKMALMRGRQVGAMLWPLVVECVVAADKVADALRGAPLPQPTTLPDE